MASQDLLLKIARLSYESQMTNEEIADQLFTEGILTSRNTKAVAQLLDEAVLWLIDHHERRGEEERNHKELRDLEARLCDKYELLAARLVPGGETHGAAEYAALLRRWGRAAAEYFDDVSSDAEDNGEQLHVAVSGGQTILDMMSSLPERRRPNVHFYAAALIGRGTTNASTHIGPETNASAAWSRSGRIPERLFYGTVRPYYFTDRERTGLPPKEKHDWISGEILNEARARAALPAVREILEKQFGKINMAIAGLGLVRPLPTESAYGSGHIEKITMTSLLRPFGIDPARLTDQGACGEISYCMFDGKGQGKPEWNYFLTAGEGTPYSGVEFYRSLVDHGRKVVVIAGTKKWAALLPAINARLFNVLISDAWTAQRLLQA